MTHLDRLLDNAKILLPLTQKQKLVEYINLLNKWNKAYNLTAVRDPHDMLIKHIIDSIVVNPYLQGKTFIDVGTGAGLPGIPLSIINPHYRFTLLDSLGKRIRFLKHVKYELMLDNIELIQCRVEDYTEYQFDGIISRAFASLSDMVNWCQHLLNDKGHFYALKGNYPHNELKDIPNLYKIDKIVELNIPELDAKRHLVMIKK